MRLLIVERDVALSPKVHVLGKTRLSVRNSGRSAAEARGRAVRHLRRQIRVLVAWRALPTSKARCSLHSVKSAFVNLRRSHCYGVSKAARPHRMTWRSCWQPRCDAEKKRTLRLY
jgi:hypothetical protein